MAGRLEKLREMLMRELDRGKGRRQICREIGIPTASLYNYIYTDTQPSVESLIKLAHYFKLPPSYFINGEVGRMIPDHPDTPNVHYLNSKDSKDIPILDAYTYKKWRDYDDITFPACHATEFQSFCTEDHNAFFVMPTKDKLFLVEPGRDIADGNIVLACIGEEITIRRINKRKNVLVLCPIDGEIQPVVLDEDEAKKIRFYRITKEISDI